MVDYGGGGLHKYPQTTLQRKRRFQHYRFLGNHWPDPSTSKWKLCHFTSKRSNLRHTYSFSFFTIYIFHSQTLPPLGSVSVDSLSLSFKMRMSCNGCRVLRKGCTDNCCIRPCLQSIKNPDAQANATLFLAKFYGRAGLTNLITAGPDHLRPGKCLCPF